MDHAYGIELSHIFKIPSISNEKPSILIGNIRFWSKKAIFQIKKFEILGFLHVEFETLCISSEIQGKKNWNFDWKAGTKMIITFGGCCTEYNLGRAA